MRIKVNDTVLSIKSVAPTSIKDVNINSKDSTVRATSRGVTSDTNGVEILIDNTAVMSPSLVFGGLSSEEVDNIICSLLKDGYFDFSVYDVVELKKVSEKPEKGVYYYEPNCFGNFACGNVTFPNGKLHAADDEVGCVGMVDE